MIDVLVINSSLANHEVIKDQQTGKYSIIWDTKYWKYFEKFLAILQICPHEFLKMNLLMYLGN